MNADPDARYFDYAASAPPWPEALRRFEQVSAEAFGNPSASHAWGRKARTLLEGARQSLLDRTGFRGDLVLSSGATEANNLVLRSVMGAFPKGRLLLAADVHASAWFAKELWPGRVDILPTGPNGLLDPGRLAAALNSAHVLCSLVHANNETGVIQDLAALAAVCASRKVPLHADCVQILGHLPADYSGATYATFSAHKFGGPRGVGGVFTRAPGLAAQISGGGQERGRRSGTEPVAGLAAAALALELSLTAEPSETPRLRELARTLTQQLLREIPGLLVNSDTERGLPGLVSVCLPGLTGETVAVEMSLRGFALSAGAACGSGRMEPSRVVLAMGRTREQALGTLRISMGRGTTPASVQELAATLREVVEKQRALA